MKLRQNLLLKNEISLYSNSQIRLIISLLYSLKIDK